MTTRTGIVALAFLLLAPVAAPAHAQTDSSEAAGIAAEQAGRLRDALQSYLTAFQALPDRPRLEVDRRLRERIIRVAARLNPPPAPPEEAHRRNVRGQALFREAEETQDTARVREAAAELWHAVRAAPWLPGPTFNLAIAQETLKQYPEARQNFELYLLASPGASDSGAVRARIYELELMAERTATERAAALRATMRTFKGALRVSLVGGQSLEAREASVDTMVRFSCLGLLPSGRCAPAAKTLDLPPDAVVEIRRRGSHAGTGFWIGFVAGIGGGLAYGLTRPEENCSAAGVDEGKCTRDIIVALGIMAGPMITGPLIGSAIPKWKRVYPSR